MNYVLLQPQQLQTLIPTAGPHSTVNYAVQTSSQGEHLCQCLALLEKQSNIHFNVHFPLLLKYGFLNDMHDLAGKTNRRKTMNITVLESEK